MTNVQPKFLKVIGTAITEAVEWRIHFAETDIETCLEFEVWIANPMNQSAWSHVDAAWEVLGEHKSDSIMLDARNRAVSNAKRAQRSNIKRRSRLVVIRTIAAGVFGVAALWNWHAWSDRTVDYQTAFGERRVLTLADGSKVFLDSDSDLTVHYTRAARELRLIKGQARFDVAHNAKRPFSVLVRNQKVIATGTAFNINLSGQKVFVTLIEGHVIVLDEGSVSKTRPSVPHLMSVELKAGQLLEKDPLRAPLVKVADIRRETAWTDGKVVFDDEPLASVVAQVNRYSAKPIIIDDPSVANMRMSGVFNIGNADDFIDAVTQYLPVRADATKSGVRISGRKND